MNFCSLKVEAGQLEVKQNLVKFNNFVREKQGKVVINMISTQYLQFRVQGKVAGVSIIFKI